MRHPAIIRRPLTVELEEGVDFVLERINDALFDLSRSIEELRARPRIVERELLLLTPPIVADAFPIYLVSGLPRGQSALGVWVASIEDIDDADYQFTSGVFPSWGNGADGGSIVLHYVSGLAASRSYRLRLMVR